MRDSLDREESCWASSNAKVNMQVLKDNSMISQVVDGICRTESAVVDPFARVIGSATQKTSCSAAQLIRRLASKLPFSGWTSLANM